MVRLVSADARARNGLYGAVESLGRRAVTHAMALLRGAQ